MYFLSEYEAQESAKFIESCHQCLLDNTPWLFSLGEHHKSARTQLSWERTYLICTEPWDPSPALNKSSGGWWYTPVILSVMWEWRQEDQKFLVIL